MLKRYLALALICASPLSADVMKIEVAGEANGVITIDLFEETAPAHVTRLKTLVEAGSYDGVVFHRVIDGFMAQTGDVEYGQLESETFDMRRVGRGGSPLPDLEAEFAELEFERGTLGFARSADPDSANSQFFITFEPAPHLNGQYTIAGQVVDGLDVLDAIKRGEGRNGAVLGEPDRMVSVTITE